jgi:hypothetical protein
VLAAVRAAAQEPERFFIERVDVRNARRVSRDVIIAESRLRPAHAYTEAELREAASRVTRAPYLLSADFALEKGSERGRYVLVITVNETKPFFFRLDAVPIIPGNPHARLAVPDVGLASENDLAVGARWFVGRRGEIHGGFEAVGDNRSYTADYGSYVLGYTQYDILGSRAFATLNIKKPQNGNGTSSLTPQLVAGIPLSINQTITLSYDGVAVAHRSDSLNSRLTQRIAIARWSYNTTNHPLLPTRGTYVTFSPIAVWRDSSGTESVFNRPENERFVVHSRSIGVDVNASRWWELTDRNSAGASASAGYAGIDERGKRLAASLDGTRRGRSNFATLNLSAAHSFWTPEQVARQGDSRIELNLRLGTRTEDQEVFTNFESGHVRQVSISWIRRTSWGLIRLGGGYAW